MLETSCDQEVGVIDGKSVMTESLQLGRDIMQRAGEGRLDINQSGQRALLEAAIRTVLLIRANEGDQNSPLH